jgi:hypothetical protein
MALAIIKRNPVTTFYRGGKNLVSTTSSILTKELAGAAPESTMNRQFPATAAAKSFPLPRPLGARIRFNEATAFSATSFAAFVR